MKLNDVFFLSNEACTCVRLSWSCTLESVNVIIASLGCFLCEVVQVATLRL